MENRGRPRSWSFYGRACGSAAVFFGVAAVAWSGLSTHAVADVEPAPVAPPQISASIPNPDASPGESPAPAAVPTPAGTPTQPPIIVDPPSGGVTVGGTQQLRVLQVLGTVTVTVADPSIVSATVDQGTRAITIVGRALGSTTLTVSDSRGLTRQVAVRVALPAGSVAPFTSIRITGNPATSLFVKEQAIAAAVKAATLRPGANVVTSLDSIALDNPLRIDDVVTLDVPVIIQGDQYFTTQGTTRVLVVNDAQPTVRPETLLVSDFPETLTQNGILFGADISSSASQRFLYYHYNPPAQPDRRIVLKLQNASSQPARVQFIEGSAGPGPYEMEVGHLSTERFLVHLAQNEGTVITIPGQTTVTLFQQALPAKSVVSGLLQLHEIEGPPLHMTLLAQDAADPIDGPVQSGALLSGDHPHARGVYPIPEFFFDGSYDCGGPQLEMPIGQIPLPNLVQGQTLGGDYGVLQQLTLRINNFDPHNACNVAIYANPRGGRATGTFIIDGVLLQAHAMAPFGHYKLRQYSIPPGSFVRTEIRTMPEGGSSYPLRLVVAPDDGSAPPGSPESLVY